MLIVSNSKYIVLLFSTIPLFSMDLRNLSLEEKIAQLCIIPATSDENLNEAFLKDNVYKTMGVESVKNLIKTYQPGGVIFLGSGTTTSQRSAIKQLKNLDNNILIVQDGEWGLRMRLTDVLRLPKALTLGALQEEDDQLIYDLGYLIGLQCQQEMVDINLAPDADVNSNPQNPIINDRSFGQDSSRVAKKAFLWAKGLQKAGIAGCGKHAPGHGDLDTDSHHMLPTVTVDKNSLEREHIPPFVQLAQEVKLIMTAHLAVPALDDTGCPASLSKPIIDYLKHLLGDNYLLITDGLGMKGATDYCAPGDLEVQALKAGNDILLCPPDLELAIHKIKLAVQNGEIKESEINEKVEKVWDLKKWIAAQKAEINDKYDEYEAQELKKTIYEKAVTVARNKKNQIPLPKNNSYQLILVDQDEQIAEENPLIKELIRQDCIEKTYLTKQADIGSVTQELIENNKPLIISLHGMLRQAQKNYGLSKKFIKKVNKIATQVPVVLLIFGNPYSVSYFGKVDDIMVGYEDEPEAQEAVAKILAGIKEARGQLPVEV